MSNAADESQVKEASKKEKHGRELEVDDLKFVLAHPQGRRFIWRTIAWCGVYRDGFDPNNSLQSFNAGMRNVGLRLLAEAESADKNLFKQMQKEA